MSEREWEYTEKAAWDRFADRLARARGETITGSEPRCHNCRYRSKSSRSSRCTNCHDEGKRSNWKQASAEGEGERE